MISTRRKSCFTCARGKRRCDLGFPECGRCLARRAICVYAWITPKEAQDAAQSNAQIPCLPQGTRHCYPLDQSGPNETPQWDYHLPGPGEGQVNDDTTFGSPLPLTTTPFSLSSTLVPLLDEITGRKRVVSFLTPDLQLQSSKTSYLDTSSISDVPPSEKIGVLTTSLQIASDSPITTGRIFQARTEYAAGRLKLQTRALAQTGQTAFIHHTHISNSSILRDALAACSLDAIRNSMNSLLVRSEIEKRVSSLIEATETAITLTPPGPDSTMTLDLLPAVQAMLIYQCMRLFSTCDVAQQGQAERDTETLTRWVDLLHAQAQWSLNRKAGDPNIDPDVWKDWIQIESIRRTMVFAELLNSIYTYLKLNWYQANARLATLSFTGQAALWEARSVAAWQHAVRQRPCFDVTISNFRHDIKEALPKDLDELGILIRVSYDGVDAVEEWCGGDDRLLEKWGLRPQDRFVPSCW